MSDVPPPVLLDLRPLARWFASAGLETRLIAFKLMLSAVVATSVIAIGKDRWLILLLLPLGVALLLPKQLNDVAGALAIGALTLLAPLAWVGVFFAAILSLNRHNETIRYVIAASLLTTLLPFSTSVGGRSPPEVGRGRISSGVCACAYCLSVAAIGFGANHALELFSW